MIAFTKSRTGSARDDLSLLQGSLSRACVFLPLLWLLLCTGCRWMLVESCLLLVAFRYSFEILLFLGSPRPYPEVGPVFVGHSIVLFLRVLLLSNTGLSRHYSRHGKKQLKLDSHWVTLGTGSRSSPSLRLPSCTRDLIDPYAAAVYWTVQVHGCLVRCLAREERSVKTQKAIRLKKGRKTSIVLL